VRDPRIDEYARLLVDRSVGVQPGWQVQVRATPLARPLVEAVLEQIARRGAYPLLQMTFETIGGPFAREAPLETLRVAAPLQRRIWEEADAFIAIWAPENTREGSELSEERKAALQQASTPMRERTMGRSAKAGSSSSMLALSATKPFCDGTHKRNGFQDGSVTPP